jgi:hypothetical protein
MLLNGTWYCVIIVEVVAQHNRVVRFFAEEKSMEPYNVHLLSLC